MTVEQMRAEATRPYNPMGRPAPHDWLKASQTEEDRRRLVCVGNIVFPKQAALAINLIGHAICESLN